MLHLPELIQDLAIILMTAAAVTLLCKFLRQPVVLGYLIAGFLVGPHFPFLPVVTDMESIKAWADIGVVFLLFGLGLEFSFKKLAKVGGSASLTACFEISCMLGLGYLAGRFLGWTSMDSLFIGGMVSISSTTIIVRAFSELGLKKRSFVQLVFGILVVEDLMAVLIMVLLSTVAVTRSLSGQALVTSAIQLAFFLALWFVVGISLVPGLLQRLRPFLSDETTLIVSLGLCLLMVLIATRVGLSPALGAFVMGSILAETREGHRIERLIVPVRDLFAAVFFVSVGMLLDPHVLAEHWGPIVLLTLITILGKSINVTLGALVAGQGLRNSMLAGMSLAQIGEFSFIIAALGLTLNVTSGFLYPIAVAVSAITTFTTPYLIRCADPFHRRLEASLPTPWRHRMEMYQSSIHHHRGHNILLELLKQNAPQVVLNGVLMVAVALASKHFLLPVLMMPRGPMDPVWSAMIACATAMILGGPFLFAVVSGTSRDSKLLRLQAGVTIVRVLVAVLLVGFVINCFTSLHAASEIMLVLLVIVAVLCGRFAGPLYRFLEEAFLTNLNENNDESPKDTPTLAPWQVTLAEYVVSPDSPLVAKNLAQSRLKEDHGVTIAMIQRGHQRFVAPAGECLLLPHDRIYLIGPEDHLQSVQLALEYQARDQQTDTTVGLESLLLDEASPFISKSIRDAGLRERVQGLIVGVERMGERWLAPDAAFILSAGDLLWIVGDKEKIIRLRKESNLHV